MAEKLGALLIRKGLVHPRQVEDALKTQLIYGGKLGTNLIELGFIEVDALSKALSEQLRYPEATEHDLSSVTRERSALITADKAEKHLAIPFAQEGRRVKVAFADPDPGSTSTRSASSPGCASCRTSCRRCGCSSSRGATTESSARRGTSGSRPRTAAPATALRVPPLPRRRRT